MHFKTESNNSFKVNEPSLLLLSSLPALHFSLSPCLFHTLHPSLLIIEDCFSVSCNFTITLGGWRQYWRWTCFLLPHFSNFSNNYSVESETITKWANNATKIKTKREGKVRGENWKRLQESRNVKLYKNKGTFRRAEKQFIRQKGGREGG